MKKEELRIVFMGTPGIAVASLNAIRQAGYPVVGVVTAPDKPAGRGRKLQHSDVKQFALDHDLPLLQPTNLKSDEFVTQLKQLQPHIIVVVAFRMLPKVVWETATKGTFNMHASLLPQYRGAAPINWAIINDEKITGVSTFFIDDQIDTGNIIAQKSTSISPDDTAGTLHDRLMELGAQLVVETLEGIRLNTLEPKEQSQFLTPQTQLKAAPKLFKEDCKLDWSQSALEIHNKIRGLNPYPTAFDNWQQWDENFTVVKIFASKPLPAKHTYPTGELFTDNKNYIRISCSDGFLDIISLQVPGKKRMNTPDFLRGYHFEKANSLK